MQRHESNIEKKSQVTNFPCSEKFKLLKSGGAKIVKKLKESRKEQLSDDVRKARKQLKRALKINPKKPELQHVRMLAAAIQEVIDRLNLTKKDFHSKGLLKIRESADDLLKVAGIKSRKHTGGMPIRK